MPGFKIPDPFKWEVSFEVFYESLDEEHKGLFDGIAACEEDRASLEKLTALCQKVKTHFTNEEARMSEKNYLKRDAHKGLHDKFLNVLEGLSVPLPDDDVDYMKRWLVDHIKDNDFGYRGKLDDEEDN